MIKTIKIMIALIIIQFSSLVSAAPVFQLDPKGLLMGVDGISVGTELYNVSFAKGSCEGLFGGCDSQQFAFSDESSALMAAQSLIDSVFVNILQGSFDYQPWLINGCQGMTGCSLYTPFSSVGSLLSMAVALNAEEICNSCGEDLVYSTDMDFLSYSFSYCLWTPVSAQVAEPASLILFGLGLAAIAYMRRRVLTI